MLNSLPLIIVMILSLFLAFYCVDLHKNTILSLLKIEENISIEEPLVDQVYNEVIVAKTEVVDVDKNKSVELPVEVKIIENKNDYGLDELERMILEELKNGEKD